MKITSIYDKYPVPELLRKHQLRAASVGKLLSDNIIETRVDQDLIIKSLLVHDMGNIIKFNLNNPLMMTDKEKSNIDHWVKEQEVYKEKYSSDDHLATLSIVTELNLADEIKHTLLHSGSSKLKEVILSGNFNTKIVTYSDLRSAPFGVVSIDERFDDVINRYKNSEHPLSSLEEVENRRILSHDLERQIGEIVETDLDRIDEAKINQLMMELSRFQF
jgi:hypothetical protein